MFGRGRTVFDQFYTRPHIISDCLAMMTNHIGSVDVPFIVDASCGDNQFLNTCRLLYPKATLFASDIQSSAGVQKDFRHLRRADIHFKKGGLLGFNPPFGRNGKAAKDYLEHMIHLQQPTFILILLPDSLQLSNISGYELVFVSPLPTDSFYRLYDGKIFDSNVSCYFFKCDY